MNKAAIIDYTDEQFQVILDGFKSDDHLASKAARIAFLHTNYERLVNLLNGADITLQRYAIRQLGNRGELRAIDLLLEKLDHADNSLATLIVYALGELQDQKAVEPLIKRLAALKDETKTESIEESVHMISLWVAIILALTKIGGERVLDIFKYIQKNGNEGERRVVEPIIEEITNGSKYSKDKRIRAFEDYKERHVEALDWLEGALRLQQKQQQVQSEKQASYQEQLDEKQGEILKITDVMIFEATGKDWQTWHKILKHWGIEKNGYLRAVAFLENRHRQTFEWAWKITVHYKQALKLEGKNLNELVWRQRSKKIKDWVEQ